MLYVFIFINIYYIYNKKNVISKRNILEVIVKFIFWKNKNKINFVNEFILD